MNTQTSFAVLRGVDDNAMAIFADIEEAQKFAAYLNESVPFDLALNGKGQIWHARPWLTPADLFSCDDKTPDDIVEAMNASMLLKVRG